MEDPVMDFISINANVQGGVVLIKSRVVLRIELKMASIHNPINIVLKRLEAKSPGSSLPYFINLYHYKGI